MPIDHRHIYGIMLDTETANTIEDNGKLDMSNVLPYDIGFAIIDTKGRVYEKHSFVIADIYLYEKNLMASAYYANKLPQYEKDLRNGKRLLRTAKTIRSIIYQKIKEYGCKFAVAHNARFDYTACNNLLRWTTKSKYRYFLPYGIEWWDTLKMARDVIGKMPTYRNFCIENNYLTKNGRLRFTAEILYRFISKDNSFVESHTGLEDVEIEVKILEYCKRQHKPMRKALFNK